MIIQTFYNGVTQSVWLRIDATAGGTLMNKTEDEASNLIEEMALNNFQWSIGRGQLGGLEVSLKLMHLLYFMLKLML